MKNIFVFIVIIIVIIGILTVVFAPIIPIPIGNNKVAVFIPNSQPKYAMSLGRWMLDNNYSESLTLFVLSAYDMGKYGYGTWANGESNTTFWIFKYFSILLISRT